MLKFDGFPGTRGTRARKVPVVQIEKKLEVSKNVKYIAVTSRASKLQVFKVGELRDLNPGLPRESISLC